MWDRDEIEALWDSWRHLSAAMELPSVRALVAGQLLPAYRSVYQGDCGCGQGGRGHVCDLGRLIEDIEEALVEQAQKGGNRGES